MTQARTEIEKEYDLINMKHAAEYAKSATGCLKVAVGSLLLNTDQEGYNRIIFGANEAIPNNCKSKGCLRVEKYGDNSSLHRLPTDCRAVHSEAVAIAKAAYFGVPTDGATIYITREPCENCARLIAVSGIKRVVYGRNKEISTDTKRIFESAEIRVDWLKDWNGNHEEKEA